MNTFSAWRIHSGAARAGEWGGQTAQCSHWRFSYCGYVWEANYSVGVYVTEPSLSWFKLSFVVTFHRLGGVGWGMVGRGGVKRQKWNCSGKQLTCLYPEALTGLWHTYGFPIGSCIAVSLLLFCDHQKQNCLSNFDKINQGLRWPWLAVM